MRKTWPRTFPPFLLVGWVCFLLFGYIGETHAKGNEKVGFANYTFKTLPKPTKEAADKLYKLVETAQSFRDKKAAAEAKAKLKTLTVNDLPTMFRVIERRSDAAQYFYPLMAGFGPKALVAVDVILVKKAPYASHYSYARRDKYLRQLGAACAAFGKAALPALKAALVAPKQYPRRAAAWGLALMGKAAYPTLKVALSSPRARERIGALYVLKKLSEKEVTPFAKELLQSMKTTEALKDLGLLKYMIPREFVLVLAKAGPTIPNAMVDILSSPKASYIEKQVAPKVLKKIGPKAKSVVGKLIPMLASKDEKVQKLGVVLITAIKMKVEQAYPALQRLVKSAKEPLRSEAARALFVAGDDAKRSVETAAKALRAALQGLKKEEVPYSHAIEMYLDGLKLLKEKALPAKDAVIEVISHPKAAKKHIMAAVSVLKSFPKEAQSAAKPIAEVMKKLKFYSYQKSRLTDFLLSTGEAGFAIAAPALKKALASGSSYSLGSLMRKLKKVGKPASMMLKGILKRGAKVSSGSTRKKMAKTIAWMATHQPKIFAELLQTKEAKERELLLIAIASDDALLKSHTKAMKLLLTHALKEHKTYNSDTLADTMRMLYRKRKPTLLVPLKEEVTPFLKVGPFMCKLYAKYVIKKIEKLGKK
ncbi:MAG TPA: hypothetical protein DCE42_08850 [Myxococcales bacterium]|nr:hypothetical protein [Myxococcales bacterium]